MKVARVMSALDDQRSPLPVLLAKASILKLFARRQDGNKIPARSMLTHHRTKYEKSLSLKHQSDEELHELRTNVELLHSFLPKKIIETIHHNWSQRKLDKNGTINEGYNTVNGLTACSSTSSSQHSSVPTSLFIPQEETGKDIRLMVNEEGEDVSVVSFDLKHDDGQRSNSATTSSKALYSKEVNDVCIAFVNIVDFSRITSEVSPFEVLDMLQNLFHRFDIISEEHNILKLDTIGDAYLCCSGCFEELDSADHPINDGGQSSALRILEAAKQMVREAGNVPVPKSSPSCPQEFLSVRIGIHIGDATFGVLGQSLPKLICVGRAVNMAARMEQTSTPNMIHVTKDFHDVVGEKESEWEFRETVKIKNMGEAEAYLLDPLKGEQESQWC